MRHFVPLPTKTGWAVAYGNHRGEFVTVMECATLESAYQESAAMTLDDTKTAICENRLTQSTGNRYLRKYA